MTIPLTELRSEDAAPVRPVRLGPREAVFDHRPDGTIYIRSPHQLAPYPVKLTERLEYWAKTAPDRTFMAQRDAGGGWRRLSYAQTLDSVRRIATALLKRNLTPERPVVDPLRQRPRARAPGLRRDVYRHPLRADLAALLVDLR